MPTAMEVARALFPKGRVTPATHAHSQKPVTRVVIEPRRPLIYVQDGEFEVPFTPHLHPTESRAHLIQRLIAAGYGDLLT